MAKKIVCEISTPVLGKDLNKREINLNSIDDIKKMVDSFKRWTKDGFGIRVYCEEVSD